MFRKFHRRSKERLVTADGYVDLSTACKRANETGYFGLASRVAPESFDGKDTNIDPRECFFGGRRVELACSIKNASDLATKAQDTVTAVQSNGEPGPGSGQSE